MRTWRRSAAGFACGRCAGIFPAGTPVLRLVVAEVKRIKFRCPSCAGEPVPADVPDEFSSPAPAVTSGFVPVRQLAGLPLDWGQRQLAREPGEEG